MIRGWVVNALTGVCCVLALGVVGLWVRSWSVGDDVVQGRDFRQGWGDQKVVQFWSSKGQLAIGTQRNWIDDDQNPGVGYGNMPPQVNWYWAQRHEPSGWMIDAEWLATTWRGWGWRWATEANVHKREGDYQGIRRVQMAAVALPHWGLAVIFGVLPLVRIAMAIRRRGWGGMVPRWRTIGRCAGNTGAALSLMLLLITLSGWVLSCWWTLHCSVSTHDRVEFSVDADDTISTSTSLRQCHVAACRDGICLNYGAPENPPAAPWKVDTVIANISAGQPGDWRPSLIPDAPPFQLFGIRAAKTTFHPFGSAAASRPSTVPAIPPVTLHYRGWLVPYWMVLVVSSVLPGIWVRRRIRAGRRERRLAQGLCAECGYDLRASPGRCPECGAGIRNAVKFE